MGPIPKDLLGLGRLTRMVDSGLPFEALRDPELAHRLQLGADELQQVSQALRSFAPLFARDTGIEQVWRDVEKVMASAGLGYSKAGVLEQLGDRLGGVSWVSAGAVLEKKLHQAVPTKITAQSRALQSKTTDPRKAGSVEKSGTGARAQEWYFDAQGKGVALHRNLNALWSNHEVGPGGQILRLSDRAEVGAQAELRQALFEDKLGQLSELFVTHSRARRAGHGGVCPTIERAASDAHALLLRLAGDDQGLLLRLINHRVGTLHPPEASGEQWFTDKFDRKMALHLPLQVRLHRFEASGAIHTLDGKDVSADLSLRKDLFEQMHDHYDTVVHYLEHQLCPPDARKRLEQTTREHRAALELLTTAGTTRQERDWSREARGRLFIIDYHPWPLALGRSGAELEELHRARDQAIEAGKDASPLTVKLERTARAFEAEIISAQPKVSVAQLLAQVDGLLGLSAAPQSASPASPAPPSAAAAKQAYQAFVQSFQTGVRAPQAMAVLDAALSDPAVTIVKRTAIHAGVNAVELVQLSNGLSAIWKPTSGERSDTLRDYVEPMFQARRERAAYLIDKHMSHHAGAPPTSYREIEGQMGCLQLFTPGTSAAELGLESHDKYGERVSTLNEKVEASAKRPIALFDQVLGNLDRHGGNFLVIPTAQGNRLAPIDHGLSLPLVNGRQDSSSVLEETHKLGPADQKALSALISSRGALVAELLELKIDPRAILSLFERVGELSFTQATADDWSNRGARGA